MTKEFRFSFPDENALVFTGATARYKANLLALETLKALEASQEYPTAEQLLALAHYTGWGDTQVYKQAFPEGNYNDATADARIEAILSKKEQLSVADSILNAHYTALPIIKTMYDTLLHLGMRSTSKQPLRILEPAGGSGNFIGMMPPELRDHSRINVVEMDEISCRIMEHLYPETNIENKQFENCYFPKNSFDLIISNVPFGQGKIFDPVFIKPNYLKLAIHDYYFARAVQLAKPGGIIAFITSRYTLDKSDNQVRKFLAENTELLAITRLPSDTFKVNAGTEVVTDILILRKKTEEERVAQYYANDEAYPDWVSVKQAEWLTGTIYLNQRYVEKESLIAGIATTKYGQHYMRDFTVEPTARPTAGLATEILISQLTANSYQYTAPLSKQELIESEVKVPPTEGLVKEPLRNKRFTEQIEALYTQAKEMLDLQARGVLSGAVRATLRSTYNLFRESYGAINHKNNTSHFQTDHPCFGLLSALEEPETFAMSAILTGESIRGEGEMPTELMPTDALSICLNKFGDVNLGFIANLLDETEEQVVAGLTERIYLNIEGDYELTETFCAGNVRKKLQDYERRYLQPNAEQQRAIEALTKSIPAWIPWTGIGAKLGSPWIPADVIELFIKETLNVELTLSYVSALGSWNMSSTHGYGVECRQTYGTSHVNALELIDDGLNLRTPKVMKRLDDPERYVVDQGESLAAQAKLVELKLKFIEWLSDDTDRVERLEKIYNETHNNFKEPTYDGSHLTLPGLSLEVTPRPHQKNMVWRMILSQSSLAAHVGGAGKTGEAIMAAMELRRMGLVKKPVAVVPNGLTKQWADEARMFYPAMKIYAPDKESLSAKNRAKLLARIATGDFDLLILPYTAMKALPMKAEAMREYIVEQVEELEDFLREDEHKTNKQIKRAAKALKVKLATIDEQIKRDDQRNITFEETGIDFLIVDEAHNFKNLFYTTKAERVAGMPNTDSQRAFDLFLKTQYLMKRRGRLALLTATPVSNSIVETYTAMRYTMLAEMKELGIAHFDAWLQTYAETTQTLEMRPDCSGFRMVTRLSKFSDLPELRALWGQTLDIKTSEQLQLDRPEIIGGKPEVVTIAQSPELKEIIDELAIRSSKVDPRTPEKDNMLCITRDRIKSGGNKIRR